MLRRLSSVCLRTGSRPVMRLLATSAAPALLSDVRGGTDPLLMNQTIGDALSNHAESNASRLAMVDCAQDKQFTFHELNEEAIAVAGSLRQLGLEKGDRIGVWLPNMYQYLVLQYAAAKMGVILVTLNPSYRETEVEFALKLSGCKALFVHPVVKSSNYISLLSSLLPEMSSTNGDAPGQRFKRLPDLRHVIHTSATDNFAGTTPYTSLVSTAAHADFAARPTEGLSPHDVINIQFTSGTTGRPKGVALSHHNILNNGLLVGHRMRLSHVDRVCIPVPLFHCFGLVMGNLACLTHGSAVVYPSPTFDAGASLKAAYDHSCTAMHGVPTMFIAMLNHPTFKSERCRTLRTGVMAGSVCPIETVRQVIDRMHMKEFTIGYGMTETSPVSFQTTHMDSLIARTETVGLIQPHTHCRVVDPITHETLPINVPGELVTSGYGVMKGYWNDPEKTAETVKNGWMHTGDLATIDELGYCRIVGRIKDIIIRGGENLSPREVEDFFFEHPDVLNVSVVGVPDPHFGEAVCAWIVPMHAPADAPEKGPFEMPELEATLRAYCKDRIAHYKVPKYFMFAKELHLTANGKVQKFMLRDDAIKNLGLGK